MDRERLMYQTPVSEEWLFLTEERLLAESDGLNVGIGGWEGSGSDLGGDAF